MDHLSTVDKALIAQNAAWILDPTEGSAIKSRAAATIAHRLCPSRQVGYELYVIECPDTHLSYQFRISENIKEGYVKFKTSGGWAGYLQCKQISRLDIPEAQDVSEADSETDDDDEVWKSPDYGM